VPSFTPDLPRRHPHRYLGKTDSFQFDSLQVSAQEPIASQMHVRNGLPKSVIMAGEAGHQGSPPGRGTTPTQPAKAAKLGCCGPSNRVPEPCDQRPPPLCTRRCWMLCSSATQGTVLRSRPLVSLSSRRYMAGEVNRERPLTGPWGRYDAPSRSILGQADSTTAMRYLLSVRFRTLNQRLTDTYLDGACDSLVGLIIIGAVVYRAGLHGADDQTWPARATSR
jgi:hypothetical protein